MKFVSVDIETTGLDPFEHQILSIGMVVVDTDQTFHLADVPKREWRLQWDRIIGDPAAIAMNAKLIEDMVENSASTYHPESVVDSISAWLTEQGVETITWAGKNVAGFDLQFLRQLPDWDHWIDEHHRTLDPGSMFCGPDDEVIPGLGTIMKCIPDEFYNRVGINLAKLFAHSALDDALMVAAAIAYHWGLDNE